MSHLEDKLFFKIKLCGLPTPVKEHKFHPTRKWRFDFAYPALKIGIECEGGIWVNGAHTRGGHYQSDCEKYNESVLLGWRVLRFTSGMIKGGSAIQAIDKILGQDATKIGKGNPKEYRRALDN